MCNNKDELEKLNTQVIIISFGTLPNAQQWLKEACPSFTVLLDRDRNVYKDYELERSYLRSHDLKTIWLFVKAWLSREKIRDSNGDDKSQLGGDFIVDKNGLLRLAHPSHNSSDRPPVEDLFAFLKTLAR